jgi:hypothetical protein
MDGANCTSVRDTLCLVSPGHPRVGGDELNLSEVVWTLQPMHRNRHRGLQCQGIDLNTKCGAVSEDPSPSLYNYVITNTVTVESHKDGFRVVGWCT